MAEINNKQLKVHFQSNGRKDFHTTKVFRVENIKEVSKKVLEIMKKEDRQIIKAYYNGKNIGPIPKREVII